MTAPDMTVAEALERVRWAEAHLRVARRYSQTDASVAGWELHMARLNLEAATANEQEKQP